jgi:hypothetical protein
VHKASVATNEVKFQVTKSCAEKCVNAEVIRGRV